MTNIKARGFDSTAQLYEHLNEVVDEAPVEQADDGYDDLPVRKEIAWLRKEVADLREHLSIIREQADDLEISPKQEVNPWLRIVVTVATAYVLGRVGAVFAVGSTRCGRRPTIAAQRGLRFR
jgi:hypothetical protein